MAVADGTANLAVASEGFEGKALRLAAWIVGLPKKKTAGDSFFEEKQ